MAHPTLPLPFKQLYPGSAAVSNTSNMPYTQLLQMSGLGEQAIPDIYNQNPTIHHDFGAPSGSSLDSGYEEVDPFDKGGQYYGPNDLGFGQPCSINPNNTTGSIDYGNYGYVPPAVVPHGANGFGTYSASPELSASFQPSLETDGPYRHYQPSPSLEDASEDGRTGSMCSDSPQQGSINLDMSPRQQQQPFWPDRHAALKRHATDGSVDVKYKVEERVAPKTAPSRGRPRKRIPHTAVERRYRENLNAHLEKLRAAVPNLTAAQRRKSTDGADPMKPSKCEVLMGAVEYIKRLEAENDRLKRKLS